MNPRPAFVAWLMLATIALFAGRAHAQSVDSCEQNPGNPAQWYKYRINGQAANGGVATDYIYASKAEACATNETLVCTFQPASGLCDAGSTPWHAHATFATQQCLTEDNFTAGGIARQLQSNPAVDCPADPAPGCDLGLTGGKFTASNWRDISAVPHDFCSPVSNCKVEVRQATDVSGSDVWTMVHTADDCDVGQEDGPEAGDTEPGESCVTVGSTEYCASAAGDGDCGYLNDQFICVPDVPAGGCKEMGDGSMVCDEAADSPPAPDDGTTPGVPADPDETIDQVMPDGSGGTTAGGYDYFDPTTAADSTRPPDTGGSGGGGGGTNHGPVGSDTDGNGVPDDEEEEEEEGELPPNELVTDCDFGECAQLFYNRVMNSDLVQSVAGVGSSIPDASCPSYELEAFGETFSLSAPMCQIWDDIAPILSVLFVAIWAWVGTRIVLSA